jgi:hypothetical protein
LNVIKKKQDIHTEEGDYPITSRLIYKLIINANYLHIYKLKVPAHNYSIIAVLLLGTAF